MKTDLIKFTAQPFIRAALQSPFKPHSVLSFWCGYDTTGPKVESPLNELTNMQPKWFYGGEEFDELCKPFSPVIRAAGKNELTTTKTNSSSNDGKDDCAWDSIDGKAARLILFDQLARNCFRATDEAFAYDGLARDLSKDIASAALSDNNDSNRSKEGDLRVPTQYAVFITLCLMHSEDVTDHELAFNVLDWAENLTPHSIWAGLRFHLKGHSDVVKKFGRYPHRNKHYGRVTTAEEEEWLQSDDVPGWAKSQG